MTTKKNRNYRNTKKKNSNQKDDIVTNLKQFIMSRKLKKAKAKTLSNNRLNLSGGVGKKEVSKKITFTKLGENLVSNIRDVSKAFTRKPKPEPEAPPELAAMTEEEIRIGFQKVDNDLNEAKQEDENANPIIEDATKNIQQKNDELKKLMDSANQSKIAREQKIKAERKEVETIIENSKKSKDKTQKAKLDIFNTARERLKRAEELATTEQEKEDNDNKKKQKN